MPELFEKLNEKQKLKRHLKSSWAKYKLKNKTQKLRKDNKIVHNSIQRVSSGLKMGRSSSGTYLDMLISPRFNLTGHRLKMEPCR